MPKPKPLRLDWIIRRDMPAVLAIEQASFASPWTPDEFTRQLRHRDCIGVVAKADERVVGYIIYELHRRRLQILNLAVANADRRCGVGSRMVEKLIDKLSFVRRDQIRLHVLDGNLDAQLFFRGLGFRATHVSRGHYATGEDGYAMQYLLTPDSPVNRISHLLEKPSTKKD